MSSGRQVVFQEDGSTAAIRVPSVRRDRAAGEAEERHSLALQGVSGRSSGPPLALILLVKGMRRTFLLFLAEPAHRMLTNTPGATGTPDPESRFHMTELEKRAASAEAWPDLPLKTWLKTCETLHMWTQIVGKIQLAQTPLINHWWQVPFTVTARGLATLPMSQGRRTFQIDFDFIDHQLHIVSHDGGTRTVALAPCSVADFYGEVMDALRGLGFEVKIWTQPVEVNDPIPFEEDTQHATYEAQHAAAFWRMLVQANRVLTDFRSRFIGKCSPVHFFWGSFDLAVTRFSGRRAPEHPGGVPHLADWVMREAYSHECSSCGFWPGTGSLGVPAFYSYTYPEPKGFRDYPVRPEGAFYSQDLREFILPYDTVRQAEQPEETLMQFLQSTYEAGANLGGWDRAALERRGPLPAGRPTSEEAGPTFPAPSRDETDSAGGKLDQHD